MIQRIQSIFLALASLSGFSLFLQPMDFARVSATTGLENSLFSDGVLDIQDHISMQILTVVLGLIPLVAIFLFKKRKVQMNLGKLAIFASIALIAAAGFFYFQNTSLLKDMPAVVSLGLASPALSMIFLFLANKYIRKDDKLVRSADRLR